MSKKSTIKLSEDSESAIFSEKDYKPTKRRGLHEYKEKPQESSGNENKSNEEEESEGASTASLVNVVKDRAKEPQGQRVSQKKLQTEESRYSGVKSNIKQKNADKFKIHEKTLLREKHFCIILIVVACLLFYCVFQMKIEPELRSEINVTKIIEDMKYRFSSQSQMTYHFLSSQLKKVVNLPHEPSAPAIITLLANRGAENTASEFSKHLAKALAPGKYISINDSMYWDNDPDDIRFRIDEKVKSKYRENELNVVIIDKLHKIPFEAAMIFHGYCDHEHSPFKRAVFLFIVPLNEVIPDNASNKYLDTLAMSSLRGVWNRATDDKIDSLITRMTVAVVKIT